MKIISSLARNKNFAGYMFVLPSISVLVLFVVLPLIASLVSSLFDFNIMLSGFKYVGFGNYSNVLHDERFWNSLLNSLYFTACAVPLQIILSLLVAVAISKTTRSNIIFRTIYFLPVVCSMTVVALSLALLIDFNIGFIPANMRLLGLPVIDVLNDQTWAMPAIILISVYKGFGFTMVIIIAALQGVPRSLYEAAYIDGAGKSAIFFKITLPSIAPTLSFVTITSIIGALQVFDQAYLITKGGPLFKTETAVLYIYNRAFVTNEMGFAVANAFLLFIIILIATMISMRMSRKSEDSF